MITHTIMMPMVVMTAPSPICGWRSRASAAAAPPLGAGARSGGRGAHCGRPSPEEIAILTIFDADAVCYVVYFAGPAVDADAAADAGADPDADATDRCVVWLMDSGGR